MTSCLISCALRWEETGGEFLTYSDNIRAMLGVAPEKGVCGVYAVSFHTDLFFFSSGRSIDDWGLLALAREFWRLYSAWFSSEENHIPFFRGIRGLIIFLKLRMFFIDSMFILLLGFVSYFQRFSIIQGPGCNTGCSGIQKTLDPIWYHCLIPFSEWLNCIDFRCQWRWSSNLSVV